MTSLFQSGILDPEPNIANPLTLKVDMLILTDETYQVNVTFGINSSITRLQYSMIIFDQADV